MLHPAAALDGGGGTVTAGPREDGEMKAEVRWSPPNGRKRTAQPPLPVFMHLPG